MAEIANGLMVKQLIENAMFAAFRLFKMKLKTTAVHRTNYINDSFNLNEGVERSNFSVCGLYRGLI